VYITDGQMEPAGIPRAWMIKRSQTEELMTSVLLSRVSNVYAERDNVMVNRLSVTLWYLRYEFPTELL